MVHLYDDFFSRKFVASLLRAEPTLEVQLTLIVIQTIIWRGIFTMLARYLRRSFANTVWMKKVAKREMVRWKELIQLDQTEDEAINNYNWWTCVMLQHFAGGVCCVPILLGWMNRHGAATEMAFEISDLCEKVYIRLFHPRGAYIICAPVIFCILIHHMASTSLSLPLLLYHSDARSYHEIVFLLQGASSFVILGGLYVATLDVSRSSELLQMKIISVATLVYYIFARFIWFFPAFFKLLALIQNGPMSGIATWAIICCVGMTIFNLIGVMDIVKRVVKFVPLNAAEAKKQYGKAA